MTAKEIADFLVYAYAVIWAGTAFGVVIMVGAYLKTRRPHTVTAAMFAFCGFLYFLSVGRASLAAEHPVETIETRFTLAALAISLIVHYFVAGYEEYWQRRQLEKKGKESNGNA